MNIDRRILPEGFEFYHLGYVEAREGSPFPTFDLESALLKNEEAISFRLFGEVEGTFVLIYEHGLDPSVYAELGNVMASQIAARLNEDNGMDVMISPPQNIGETSLKKIVKRPHNGTVTHRTYVHRHESKHVVLETVLVLSAEPMAIPSGGVGHA